MTRVFPLLRTMNEVEDLIGGIEGEVRKADQHDCLRIASHLRDLIATVQRVEDKAKARADTLQRDHESESRL